MHVDQQAEENLTPTGLNLILKYARICTLFHLSGSIFSILKIRFVRNEHKSYDGFSKYKKRDFSLSISKSDFDFLNNPAARSVQIHFFFFLIKIQIGPHKSVPSVG